jgi:ATP-binding cassette subfamily B protein
VPKFWDSFSCRGTRGRGNLSAGERQLFCLARGILPNAAYLVMDEATRSVDPGTEKSLLAAATRAFSGKTRHHCSEYGQTLCGVFSSI